MHCINQTIQHQRLLYHNNLKQYDSNLTKSHCLFIFAIGFHLLYRFYEDIDNFEAEYIKSIRAKQTEYKNEAASTIKRAFKAKLARKEMEKLKKIKEAKAAKPKFRLKPLPRAPASSSLKSGNREKVLNEKTGRYVYKDGATAKKMGLSK